MCAGNSSEATVHRRSTTIALNAFWGGWNCDSKACLPAPMSQLLMTLKMPPNWLKNYGNVHCFTRNVTEHSEMCYSSVLSNTTALPAYTQGFQSMHCAGFFYVQGTSSQIVATFTKQREVKTYFENCFGGWMNDRRSARTEHWSSSLKPAASLLRIEQMLWPGVQNSTPTHRADAINKEWKHVFKRRRHGKVLCGGCTTQLLSASIRTSSNKQIRRHMPCLNIAQTKVTRLWWNVILLLRKHGFHGRSRMKGSAKHCSHPTDFNSAVRGEKY